jgi:chromosome segregation ATPase
MLTLIVMLGAAAAIAAVGSFLLYWDHQADRQRIDRAVRGLDQAGRQRDEACDRVELRRGQVAGLRQRGMPELLRCQQEASRLRGELQGKERELEEARRGRQRSEARLRELEEALEQLQGQCHRERARAEDLAEREQALAERNSRLDTEAQESAALLGAAREAGADLGRRHDDLARRHEALVGAVEECRRALGTPGWYAAS